MGYIVSKTTIIEEEEIYDIGDKVYVVSKRNNSVIGYIIKITEDKMYIRTPRKVVSIYAKGIKNIEIV